jgi:hypothetical protein
MSVALSGLFAGLSWIPRPAGLVLALLGLWALTIGSRFRRPVAILGGAFFGAVAGTCAAGWIASRLGIGSWGAVAASAAVLAVMSGLVPAAFPSAVGAMAGAAAAAVVGRAPATLTIAGIGAVAGILFARLFAALGSAAMGAGLLAVALLVLGGSGPTQFFIRYPLALLAIAGAFTVAGAAFQHRRAWPKPGVTRSEQPPRPSASQAETLPMS